VTGTQNAPLFSPHIRNAAVTLAANVGRVCPISVLLSKRPDWAGLAIQYN